MEQLEYKTATPKNNLTDYLEHIQQERSLLRLNEEQNPNDSKLKNSILQRIECLYNEATQRFPNEKSIWDEYFIFTTTSIHSKSDGSAILDNMIIHHGHLVELWLKYIKWERVEKSNERKVKNLLIRALQRHPESEDLYIEFMDVELANYRDLSPQNVLDNTIMLYNNARKQISTLSFLTSVLHRLNKYSFSKPLQLTILDDMKSMYCNKELFWHILAQRELNGLATFDEKRNKKLEQNESQSKLQKVNIQRCVKVYEAAVSKINNLEMWTLYLNAMIELNNDTTTFQSLKRSVLGCAFKAAYDAKQIGEVHCIQYINYMYTTGATDDVILNILEVVLTIHPTSTMLWESHLKFYIQCNNNQKVEEIFKTARTALGDESYPIWTLYMKNLFTLKSTHRSSKINEFFLQVVKEPSNNFRPIKIDSIEYTAALFGINEARQFFNFAINNGFPCLEMYNKMADIEELQVEPDISNWRSCLELAVQNYGQENFDVWLNFIKFELKHGDPKNSNKISERAIQQLKPQLVDTFIFTRDAFQQGIVAS